jgi:hypothetical protein
MFRGRKLLIATKHEKEKVIAPILEKELGVKCFVTSNFDTDELGTFTGEIERKENPVTTVRKKCLMAMQVNKCDLAVASEGSFGFYPSYCFIPTHEEFLIFIDTKNDLEILVRELSTETNFCSAEIENLNELRAFATHVGFPSHALILRQEKNDFTQLVKGINKAQELNATFERLISGSSKVFIETDMRAIYNPTRMRVIENLTKKLVKKINTPCPNCKTAGFGITNSKQGLPCELCGLPTTGTLSHISACQKCDFTKEEFHPNGKYTEAPMYCDVCNP